MHDVKGVKFSLGNKKWLSERAETMREDDFLDYAKHIDSRIVQRLLKIINEKEESNCGYKRFTK